MRRIATALTNAFGAKGIDLRFLPTGPATYEAFQSGSQFGTRHCLVDIVLSSRSTAPETFFSDCATRASTSVDGVGVTYSPSDARPIVGQALATLSR